MKQLRAHIAASFMALVIVYLLGLWINDGVMNAHAREGTVIFGLLAVMVSNFAVAAYYDCKD